MRGSRSLGLALVAAALGVAPAMAQQSNTAAAPATTPPAVNSGASPTHNGAAMPGAANSNGQSGSTTAATDQAKSSATNANSAPANTAANNGPSSGANSIPAPAPNAANNAPPASGNATQAPAATTANTTPPATENNKPAPANTAATNPPAASTATANKGPSGSLQKYNGEWRSSKLVGATVYNDHGDDIGKIDDMLMDDQGKIKTVVVSTGGGVLGIGAKLVSVPFDQIKFEPSVNNTTPATAGAPGGNRSANSTTANNETKTEYSVVLPGATEKSLAQQSTFKYASTD